MLFRRSQRNVCSKVLESACRPVVEGLEERRLFAFDTVQTLPFVLDFGSNRGELVDKDNQGTGFTRVQANRNNNEYQKDLIDLDTTAGVLRLTTTGNAAAGSNYNADNTLVNALETQFDGTSSGWKITTRLAGPLGFIDTPSEQAGIMFGPDQDNYIKLVAVAQPAGSTNAQYIQFHDEQTTNGVYSHTINELTSIGSFANINTLDLQLVGDASSGTVTAFYAINGGNFVKIAGQVNLSGAKYNAFFNTASRTGLIALHKNNVAPMTATFDLFKIEGGTVAAPQPKVTASRPGNGNTNVSRDAFVAADVFLPTAGAGVDASTLNSNTVRLYRTSNGAAVTAVLNTSGGGDAIVLTPTSLLDPNTSYTFEVTAGLKDTSGASFAPYAATFTTGIEGANVDPTLAFEKVALPTTQGNIYTSVNIGPDGKLYASTVDGRIVRWNINADGTLSSKFEITSLQANEGGPRIIAGLAFDSSGNLWVSHNQFTDYTVGGDVADDWSGKISRLSGANYTTVTAAVVGLPRSVRDHMTNQLAFGPDGALYFAQGGNTAMGSPDNAWGLRPEHLLNAAILRLDITKLGSTPLNVKTSDGGTYNPFNLNNALTIYATGIRNAYDMVWTSNGKLFVPTNGSAAGGNAPATPTAPYSFGANQRIDFATHGPYTGPDVPMAENAPTQNDYIFNVVQGGYYGHPNPTRGEFVLNGGNPTAGADPSEIENYPVGTLPDRNYRGNNTGVASNTQGSGYIFGMNYSPNGIIEYQGNAFGGLLKGKLLVAAYSGGDEVFVLTPDANGNIIQRQNGIAGLSHFIDPLDLTEDPNTGFLYVIEFAAARITLARPITPGAKASADKSQMVFNDTTATGASAAQKITITNTGTAKLAFNADAFSISGTNASQFAITQKPTLPMSIDPGASVDVFVTFTANSVDDIKTANLLIKTNDPNQPTITVPLRGLGTSGTGGSNEPSLQQLMNLYRIPITVGDTTPLDTDLNNPPATPNDEVVMQSLVKAGNGPVTIESLAVFGVGSSANPAVPTFRFGYYTPGNKNDVTELLYQAGSAGSQSVNPNITGVTSFDPGAAAFGLYTRWQNFTGQPTVYSEDALNKGYHASSPRKLRFYPLKDTSGTVVPNAFVFAWEEFNQATDFQDYVGIIRNVKAAPGATAGAEIGFENIDGVPFSDRLVFNKIQNNNNSGSGQPNNIYHGTSVVRIRNSGLSTLTVSSLAVTNGWSLVNPPSGAFNIPSGDFRDITVQFTANPGGSNGVIFNGTLTVNSNDADEPAAQIQLSGHWQPFNEGNKEPSLQQIVNIFGYKTAITSSGQALNQEGKVVRVGDEVLSPYWRRADATLPVNVRQIAAYHSQGAIATLFWHAKGSSTTTTLFTMDGEEAQSFLPHKNNASTGVVGTEFAAASFSPSGAFGLKIDGEWSDPTKNFQERSGGGYGHHVRFWVLRDRAGNIIPNTYLMSMDYSGINYDYQDNIYIVSNLAPDSPPAVPTGLTANSAGIALDWNNNPEPNLAGYNVYRATSSGGAYAKLNATPVGSSDYLDASAAIGTTYFYKVTAVDTSGNESAQSPFVSATRASDNIPPAAPSNLTATGSSGGVALDWANNGEADLAGYNIYRATNPAGPFTTKLNVSLLSDSAYFDASAPAGVTSYYMVEAVDSSDNKSTGSFANAMRTSGDSVPPAPPSIVSTMPSTSGIAIDWADNSEPDLAGYNVYRSPDGANNWTKLNTSGLLSASFYNDTAAPANATSFYRITAVDTSNNESTPATTSATRPQSPASAYAHVEIGSPTPAGSLSVLTANKDYNLLAGGADVWGNSDSFGFAHTQVTGDFDLIVRVAGVTNTNTIAKGGLMARETLAANSRNFFAYATPEGGYRTTYRSSPGGASTGTGSGPTTYPNSWVRLKRVGNSFQSFRSSDGVNWTPLASATISMASTIHVGMAAVSKNTSALTTAQFRDLSTFGAQPQLPPAPPTGLTASGSASGIALDWNNNSESNIAGYNVYRSGNGVSAWTKLNSSLVSVSAYNDTTAPAGATSFYRVTAVNTSGQESGNSATVDANRPSSVAAWSHLEIGNPTPAGSLQTITQNQDYNLLAGGADVWGNSDSFGFAYQQVSGNFDFVVRLAGISNTNSLAKGGLMARESLAANSRNVFGYATPGGGYRTTFRSTTGGSTSATGTGATTFPNTWIRLTRTGNTFATFMSSNGSTWSPLASTTLNLGQTMYVGLAAVSKNTGALTTAQFRDLANLLAVNDPKPSPPGLITGAGTQTGIFLNWADNPEADIKGYRIYRSSSLNGPYTLLDTGGLLTQSEYLDRTAPEGVETFYKLTAVDLAGQESDFSTVINTTRDFDVNPPAPQNLLATAGANGITLTWDDAFAPDFAGYNIYRSSTASGTFTKLNASPSPNNNFIDTQAPLGQSFYRVYTVDLSGNQSDQPATASATRVATAAPVKINFQLAGSPTVAGWLHDNGSLYGEQGNGYTYGWNGDYSTNARDRNKNSDQLLDTLMHFSNTARWTIDLANGNYNVKISIGDSEYASVHTINANGVSVFSNVSLGVNQFQQKTVQVSVTNGKLELSAVGQLSDRATRINYIEITPA